MKRSDSNSAGIVRGRSRAQRVVMIGVVVLALCVLLGGAAWLAFRSASALSTVDPEAVMVFVQPTVTAIDRAQSAELRAMADEPPRLHSTGRAGIVTEVALVVGERVQPGQIVYRVAGVGVLAHGETLTFYRSLGLGDAGEDVAALQRVLNGAPTSSGLDLSGRFDVATRAAVRQLESALGIGSPAGVFLPEMVLRIPGTGFVPTDVLIEQDANAVPAGQPVAVGERGVTSLAIVPFSALPDGDYVFTSDGAELAVALRESEWSEPPVDDATGWFDGIPTDENGVLIRIGRIRLAAPGTGLAIPASSVVTESAGSACVFVRDPGSPVDEVRIAVVEVLGVAASGAALVSDEFGAEVDVLANPGAMGRTTCRSN